MFSRFVILCKFSQQIKFLSFRKFHLKFINNSFVYLQKQLSTTVFSVGWYIITLLSIYKRENLSNFGSNMFEWSKARKLFMYSSFIFSSSYTFISQRTSFSIPNIYFDEISCIIISFCRNKHDFIFFQSSSLSYFRLFIFIIIDFKSYKAY